MNTKDSGKWTTPGYNNKVPTQDCPQLPGTLIRIFIPAGAVINLLNLIEITSPSGICLIVRIPLLAGGASLSGIIDSIKEAGGTVELVKE